MLKTVYLRSIFFRSILGLLALSRSIYFNNAWVLTFDFVTQKCGFSDVDNHVEWNVVGTSLILEGGPIPLLPLPVYLCDVCASMCVCVCFSVSTSVSVSVRMCLFLCVPTSLFFLVPFPGPITIAMSALL